MGDDKSRQANSEPTSKGLDAFDQINADTTLSKIVLAYLLAEVASKNRTPQEAEAYLYKTKSEINYIIQNVRVEDAAKSDGMRERMRETFDNLVGAISFVRK